MVLVFPRIEDEKHERSHEKEKEEDLSTDEEDKKENYRFLKRVW